MHNPVYKKQKVLYKPIIQKKKNMPRGGIEPR